MEPINKDSAVSALEIAKYIIKVCKVDPLKLQKLVFYVQAVSLVKFNKLAFSDEIQAWDYGPVIYEIYRKYNGTEADIVPPVDDPKEYPEYGYSPLTDTDIIEACDLVVDYYGKKTGIALIQETHAEKPWKEAYEQGRNTIITPEVMKTFYSSIYTFD